MIFPQSQKACFAFHKNEAYNLGMCIHLANKNMSTKRFVNDTMSSLALEVWELMPDEITLKLSIFNAKIKNWDLENCLCRFSKSSVEDIGFK